MRIGLSGKGKTTPSTFAIDAALGRFPNITTVSKFGHNADLGTTYETIWHVGGLYPWPTSASTMDVASDDVNDTSAGTGARTVYLEGLDANYNSITETVTLNGTTPVTTTGEFLRLFRMKVITAGTGGTNAGVITATSTDTAADLIMIEAGEAQSEIAIYTVPANKKAVVVSYYVDSPTSKTAEVAAFARPFGEVFQLKHHLEVNADYVRHEFLLPLVFDEKTDMDLRARSLSGGSHEIVGGFDFLLIDKV